MEIQSVEILQRIYLIRGQRVMLDSDLAALYKTDIKTLNRAVKRNLEYFPKSSVFQLDEKEYESLRCQRGTLETHDIDLSNNIKELDDSLRCHAGTLNKEYVIYKPKSEPQTSEKGRHRKYLPYVFTEQGVAALSGILKSRQAKKVNMSILETFVQLRRKLETQTDVMQRLEQLEAKQDAQFKLLIEAIQRNVPTRVQNKNLVANYSNPESPPTPSIKHSNFSRNISNQVTAIREAVAHYYELKTHELAACTRKKHIILPRQVAIYLVRKYTKLGLKEIGAIFSGKDHTTILHACNRIASLLEQDAALREAINTIEDDLKINFH